MKIPNEYLNRISTIESESGLVDDCKYMVEFKVSHSIFGTTYPIKNLKELHDAMKHFDEAVEGIELIDIQKQAKPHHFEEIMNAKYATIHYTTINNERKDVNYNSGLDAIQSLMVPHHDRKLNDIKLSRTTVLIEMFEEGKSYLLHANDINWWKARLDQIKGLSSEKVEEEIIVEYVDDWFKYDTSTKIEEQVKYNIAVRIEEHLNGHYDSNDTMEKATKKELQEYVYEAVTTEFTLNGWSVGDSRLRFFGTEKINRLIKLFIDNYSDLQPYIADEAGAKQIQPNHAEHIEYVNRKKLEELF